MVTIIVCPVPLPPNQSHSLRIKSYNKLTISKLTFVSKLKTHSYHILGVFEVNARGRYKVGPIN